MKNLFQKEFLNSLIDNHEFAYNKYRREELITNFSRLKNDTPFSPRLNEWLTDWYEKHKEIFVFVDEDDFDPKDIKGTLNRHIAQYKLNKTINIWTQQSQNSIYGNSLVNVYFRCFHSYTHVINEIGYNLLGESIVCHIQISHLPQDWLLEHQLFLQEIIAQNLYYATHKCFVSNQRLFAVNFLKNGAEAILKKQ